MKIPEEEVALLEDYVSDSVDHRGFPAGKSSTGGWRSAWFIIGVEVAERFAYFGIACNLITYLTGPLGQSTAKAAVNVNTWSGTASILPILGAFVADAYLGRYRTIVVASLIYILGLGLLTLSASLIIMGLSKQRNDASAKPSIWVNTLFFCSLYLVAIGQGGHKPCVQAFGADQFDAEDPKEVIARGSFFNWWFLSLSAGISISIIVVAYVQENVNWAFGFGIPCLFMVMALAIFLLGRKIYRYPKGHHEEVNSSNTFARIGRVFVIAFKNRKLRLEHSSLELDQGLLEDGQSEKRKDRLNFLAKAMISREGVEPCSGRDVDDAKALVRLIPIWITYVVSTIPYAQYITFFTKQGVTVDRRILPGVEIPAASLLSFVGVSILISVPLYERVFLPIARKITKKPFGITMLQRIGAGMVLSVFNMMLAALVESKRLKIAREHGLVDKPDVTVPMSIWWFVPQYLLLGFSSSRRFVESTKMVEDHKHEESILEKIVEKIHGHGDSSSLSDSDDDKKSTSSSSSSFKSKIYRLFGREKPVHKVLGGGKPADIFLWRNKKVSGGVLGAVTASWVLFELFEYHLLAFLCHFAIFALAALFLWSNACTFIHKSTPHIPEVHIPEDPILQLVSGLRIEINRGLTLLRNIASGKDVKKFILVIAGLWVLSIIGSCYNFLTLFYTATVLLFTIPVLYEKYEDKVDAYGEKAMREIKKQYAVLDEKVLRKVISKIPRGALNKKKD